MEEHSNSEQEVTLAKLTMHSDYSEFTVWCDALAITPNHFHGIMAMSLSGPDTAIKAIRAVLYDKNLDGTFRADGTDAICPSHVTLRRFTDYKYNVVCARLGLGTAHLVAVVDAPGVLRAVSEEALWWELRSQRYTTPVLRPWVAWLRGRLHEEGMLREAKCFGCNVGQMALKQDELDKLVTSGVMSGDLALTTGE